MPTIVNLESSGLRRFPRLAANYRSVNWISAISSLCACVFIAAPVWCPQPLVLFSSSHCAVRGAVNLFHADNTTFDGTLNSLHYMALAAGKENNKSYTFREMLQQEDSVEFIKAMLKEPSDHESRVLWEIIPGSKNPKDITMIMAIWSFKRKRFPDVSLNKHNARLYTH